ncbi:MAG: HAMP domain-containing histidine kinase [Lachnospiraceae bacterium]|nr:HAMP domain-containing histidine kinase [Lachnospiraceae bacterium]
MKHEKISLKWKIFAWLLVLAAVLLAVLWVCQTVYLERFYKYIKERDLKESVKLLSEAVKEEEPAAAIKEIAEENELSLIIVNSEGDKLYAEQFFQVSAIRSLTKEQLKMYYDEVREGGGLVEYNSEELLKGAEQTDPEKMKKNLDRIQEKEQDFAQGADFKIMPPEEMGRPIEEHLLKSMRGGQEGTVYAKILEIQQQEALLLVTVKLTPVEATVQTLRIQLIYISVIIIILSLLLALMISRMVSKSIIRVNESAKELARGNFQVMFDGRDYKEISQLSNTLNYAASELSKTENLQRELLANVSHDLRTPLTMIIAYSEVMRDLPDENTPENVQVVIEEAQRLTSLVNDMLDVSKLQAGVARMDKREYDLTDSINGVLERYVKLREQENYQIDFIYDRHVQICADEHKIFQVLYNLINNAVNYTGEDKKVTVRQIVENHKVRIEVCDTGNGIPKEELEYVWERYYKVDKVHKRAVQGTGLGLSICKNILKLHGAAYGVESEEGSGSVFWFEFVV